MGFEPTLGYKPKHAFPAALLRVNYGFDRQAVKAVRPRSLGKSQILGKLWR